MCLIQQSDLSSWFMSLNYALLNWKESVSASSDRGTGACNDVHEKMTDVTKMAVKHGSVD